MTSVRIPPFSDDHGDQFPGALPPVPTRRHDADDLRARMHAAYVAKVNSVVEAGQEDLARELADAYAEETTSSSRQHGARHGQRPAGRNGNARPGTTRSRWTERTRESLRRFDRYTLDVFNARTPAELRGDLTDRSN